MPGFLHDQSEKKVEYIELIYDLIFVYLVSRNGALLHTIEGGFVTAPAYLTYIASTLAILQIWYFSTLYINRYGCNSVRDHICLFINMYLLYHMADGIQADWGGTYFRYNIAWALILLNLAVQYALCLRCGNGLRKEEKTHIRYHMGLLTTEAVLVLIFIPVYLITGLAFAPWAVVLGIAIPLLSQRVDALVPVDFPHLSERMMLYIVFTFGEMILGITGYFSGGFTGLALYYSLMAFLIVAGLFSGYGYFYQHLLDQHITTTGTGYMLLHMVMILALNNITAGLEFMLEPQVAVVPKNAFLVISMLVYFLCLLLTQTFAKTRVAGPKAYGTILGGFAFFAVLMAVFYQNSMVSTALSVVFIYLQLFFFRFAQKGS